MVAVCLSRVRYMIDYFPGLCSTPSCFSASRTLARRILFLYSKAKFPHSIVAYIPKASDLLVVSVVAFDESIPKHNLVNVECSRDFLIRFLDSTSHRIGHRPVIYFEEKRCLTLNLPKLQT